MEKYFVYNGRDIFYRGSVYINSFNSENMPVHLGYDKLEDAKKALKSAMHHPTECIKLGGTISNEWIIGHLYSCFNTI